MMENCMYCIEILHPVGMLDRDQRTAKIRQQPDNYCDHNNISIPRFHLVHFDRHHLCTSSRLMCGRRVQSCHFHQKTLSRLLKVLIIGIYISFVEVPYVYSRPTSNSCQNAVSGEGNWWINPNNYNTSNANETTLPDDGTPLDKSKSLNPLLIQVNRSLTKAKESMKNNTGLKSIIEMYKSQTFTWIDDRANDSIIHHPELTKFLLETYEDFQKVAVGIDHGIAYSKVHNQVMVGSQPWEHVLHNASYQLRLVLTEIQTALMELNVNIEKNVNGDIIPNHLKFLCDNTDVGVFNAIVYRHYYNFLNNFNETLSTVVETL